jgi:sec-independent protein translocase protein TatA
MSPVIGLFSLSPMEIMIILGLGVLLFGRKLPEVGKYLGKGIVEFKKGLKGLEDEVDAGASVKHHEPAALDQPRPPQRVMTQAPKFEESPTPNNAVTTPPKV